jgi:excisionase family DNA binding protein
MLQQLRNVEEAAGLLGISKWTIRAYIKAGKLKPVRIGRRVLLAEDELQRFVVVNQEQVRANGNCDDEVRQ